MKKHFLTYFNLTFSLVLLSVFQKDFSLSAQAWNAACNGANYCDLGTIVPTTSTQLIPSSSYCSVMGGSSHSNSFNAGNGLFVKMQFAATAGNQYCFSLRTYGSGTNNGSGIEIIDKSCGNATAAYVGTSYGGVGSQYSQMKNCISWTAPATQTYYIQLSSGSCGCSFFGCCGPTGFELETLDFSYATSAGGSGACSCSAGIILPIELIMFKGLSNKEGVKLEWSTATETNNGHFLLERSSDGTNFTMIDMIQGAGNSYTIKNYSSMDYEPHKGINYYRLKQVDLNGNFSYSKIISVISLNKDKWLGEIYPNPAEQNADFEVYSSSEGTLQVQLLDITGRIVYTKDEAVVEGTQALTVPLSELAKGVYTLYVIDQNAGKQSLSKLVKN